jgi:hypothetical protein
MSKREEITRKRPATNLKYMGLIVMYPPINAIGSEVRMNAKNTLLSKQSALMYFTDAIDATTIFRIREVGLIVSGANESNAITAR